MKKAIEHHISISKILQKLIDLSNFFPLQMNNISY